MIVFEYNSKDEVLEIHGTPDDLQNLAIILNKLSNRIGDHEHLMTPSWSGDELSEKLVSNNDKLINHVKISCWKEIPKADR